MPTLESMRVSLMTVTVCEVSPSMLYLVSLTKQNSTIHEYDQMQAQIDRHQKPTRHRVGAEGALIVILKVEIPTVAALSNLPKLIVVCHAR